MGDAYKQLSRVNRRLQKAFRIEQVYILVLGNSTSRNL